MKSIYNLGVIAFVVFLTGCFEEDHHVNPVPIDDLEIPYSMYEFQTYVSLSSASVVSYHSYSDWDLGFETSKDGYHIILNSSRYMYAGNTFETNFAGVVSNTASKMLFDHSSGNLDSTVFANWADYSDPINPIFSKYVYVIDRGKSETGASFGFKKMVFEKMENDTFYIHFANLDNTEEYHCKVAKDTTVNFILLSLDDGGQIKVSEPEKSSWDFCLTKYSTIIPDDNGVPTDYLVRGALLNPSKNIEVALDTEIYFENILAEMLNNYQYSKNLDAIGYDWKYFDFDKSIYIMRVVNSYIIKNVSGANYKMRFTSFDKDGIKGFPSLEIMQLQTL